MKLAPALPGRPVSSGDEFGDTDRRGAEVFDGAGRLAIENPRNHGVHEVGEVAAGRLATY
jgi:hypothetical protein